MIETRDQNVGWFKRTFRFFGPSIGVGFVAGMVGALLWIYADFVMPDAIASFDWRNLPFFPAIIVFAYVLGGLVSLIACFFPEHGYKWLSLPDLEDLVEQRDLYIWQGITALACGGALGIVVVAEIVPVAPSVAVAILCLLSIVAAFAFWRSWKGMDELLKSTSQEAVTIAYYLVVVIGGGWAALGHFGLAAGQTHLDWLTILWTMILFSSVWAAQRRGLLEEEA